MITLTEFYTSFSAICFTVLALWLVVVQQRYTDWKDDPDMIRRAYGIGLYFSLPGIMTLLSLIDPQSSALWRTSYAIVALGGTGVIIAVSKATQDNLGKAAYYTAIVLYVLIGVIAIFKNLIRDLGLAVAPVRVEAVLLCVLVFLGVNVAWLLLFGAPPTGTHPKGTLPAETPASAAK
jgi:hypothetical protein